MVTKFEKPMGTEIGNLSSLTTSNKTSLVAATNELNSKFGTAVDTIVSNIAGVKSALASFASGMSQGEAKLVRIVHTASEDISLMAPHIRYAGYLFKVTDTDYTWLGTPYSTNQPVVFSYYSPSGSWVSYQLEKYVENTVTVTTNGSGEAYLQGAKHICSIKCSEYLAVPFHTQLGWYAKIMNHTSLEKIADTEVTITYLYIPN